jgi:hypothetical protein
MRIHWLANACLALVMAGGPAFSAPPATPGSQRNPAAMQGVTPAQPGQPTPTPGGQGSSALSRRPVEPGVAGGVGRRPAMPAAADAADSAGQRGGQNRPDFSLRQPGRDAETRPTLFGHLFGQEKKAEMTARGGVVPAAAAATIAGGDETNSPRTAASLHRGRPIELPAAAGGAGRGVMTQADRIYAQRLAQIERMYDRAIETGDTKLLDQAEHLRAIADRQYTSRGGVVTGPTPDPSPEPTPQQPAPSPEQAPIPEPTPEPAPRPEPAATPEPTPEPAPAPEPTTDPAL